MRELKFRGRDKVNGKWLYGNLEVPLTDRKISKHFILGYSYGQYRKHEVDPETVGEYTDLKDKNGTEIYEGDIINIISEGTSNTAEVTFDDGCFGVIGYLGDLRTYPLRKYLFSGHNFEIIGNIHENQELLEGGSN